MMLMTMTMTRTMTMDVGCEKNRQNWNQKEGIQGLPTTNRKVLKLTKCSRPSPIILDYLPNRNFTVVGILASA